jgi:site-specific recombinase XerD
MLDHFYSDIKLLHRGRSGPLGAHLDDFANLLLRQGYTRLAGRDKLRVILQLNQWLQARQLPLQCLDERRLRAFQTGRRRRRRSAHGEAATLALLLESLRHARVIPSGVQPPTRDSRSLLIRDYEQFLLHERGLSQKTVAHRIPVVRHFLSVRFKSGLIRPERLRARHISHYILHEARNQRQDRAQLITGTLRSFLDFLWQSGRLNTSLSTAVPTVSSCWVSELPRSLNAEQVEQLLRSCDRTKLCEQRDYAVLLLLSRLGLRAHEVVGLNLGDINWAAGELQIRGKGGREDRLPLPQDVGRGLAAYLKNGRPSCSCRRVFVRLSAPHQGFAGPSTISWVVRRALARAGIASANKGAHQLRHSLATRMLHGGASLTQIGQVLRHEHIDTTEIYARVDLQGLRALAQPWPGGVA